MEERRTAMEEVAGERSVPVRGLYEKPSLTLIGNLNDLLAGTASKDQDNGITVCAGVGDNSASC
jgi:hypothetical protein